MKRQPQSAIRAVLVSLLVVLITDLVVRGADPDRNGVRVEETRGALLVIMFRPVLGFSMWSSMSDKCCCNN